MLYVLHKFCQNRKKDTIFIKIEKRPKDRIISFLANMFKKGQMATLLFMALCC